MLLTIIAAPIGHPAAQTRTDAGLTVLVTGVKSSQGHILVAVCTPETFLGRHCPYTASAPASAGTVSVMLADVPSGTFAIQAFHDENANNDLDRTLIGFPLEGLGFSNDAQMRFGPPRFDDAAVEISAAGTTVAFDLRYYR